MFKTTLALIIIIGLAVGGGAASLAYVLDDADGTGALTIGEWTAFPKIGSAEADPYARARISREGVLALGAAEGIAFIAERDAEGQRLRLECNYVVEGFTPGARFWTLYIQNPDARLVKTSDGSPAALQSQLLVRRPDNSFAIAVGAQAAPSNWIATSGSGAMRMVLTVYDTSLAGSVELTETPMPRITRIGCNA